MTSWRTAKSDVKTKRPVSKTAILSHDSQANIYTVVEIIT